MKIFIYSKENYFIFFNIQYNFVDDIKLTDSLGWMSYATSIRTVICAEEHTNNVILINPVVYYFLFFTFYFSFFFLIFILLY